MKLHASISQLFCGICATCFTCLYNLAEIPLPASNEPESAAAIAGETKTTNEILKFALELVDGSTIVAEPLSEELPVTASFGDIKINLKLLERFSFSEDRKTITVTLRNGDRIEGTTSLKHFELRTLLGKITAPLSLTTALTTFSSGYTGPLPQGCVLYFSFDKDEEDTIPDKSGKGNDGRIRGAKWITGSKKEGAYFFDGKDDFISVAHSDSLNLTTGLTVMAWVKASAPGDGDGWDGFVCKGDTSDRNYALGRMGSKTIFWYMHGGQGKISIIGTKDICDNQWHMLAVAWDGSKAYMYVDGQDDINYEDVGRTYGLNWSTPLVTNKKALEIGRIAGPYPFAYFNDGVIDEVMIFDHALREQEIKQLHNLQKRKR